MSNLSTFPGLEDEEDLEALRFAALQSLKKNAPLPDTSMSQSYLQPSPEQSTQFWQNKNFRNKRGKPFGSQYAGRGNRTFQGFFSRARSTNLISIPTLPNKSETEEKSSNDVKLNLPQDKYVNKDEDGEKSQDSSSKFDRYNNSDKSESEEEADILLSDEESAPLKKSDSLEALMQELDNEIQGKPISEEKIKTRKSKKRKKESPKTDTTSAISAEQALTQEGDNTEKPGNTKSEHVEDSTVSTGVLNNQMQENFGSPIRKRKRSGSPLNRRNFFSRRRQRTFPPQQPNAPIMMSYTSGLVPYPPQMMPFNGQPFNPMFGPPGIPLNQTVPPFYENPLPPITINTEPLPTPILAPLSPRSAAFVLENKAIIERRRRSPRRSYSRSPSRSPVRSLSPRRSPRWSISPRRSPPRRLLPRKRSLTPKRKSLSPRRKTLSPRRVSPGSRRKSMSPKRKSPSPRRKSLSPRRKSLSPNRKSISPRRRSASPRRRSLTPKRMAAPPRSPNRRRSISPKRKGGDGMVNRAPVRDRLGMKSKTEEKEKLKLVDDSPKKEDKPLDPVLEARKRKFESNEIKLKGGIIRLRPKDEKLKDERPVELKPSIKPMEDKPKEDRPKIEKPKEELPKQKPQNDELKTDKTVEKGREGRSTTPKLKENIVEVAPATTTTHDKNDDSVPDEFKELEKLLLGGGDLELDPKVEDIFSDEDSASDNEGRFKVKEQNLNTKPPVISFRKLVNGEKRDIRTEPLTNYTKHRDRKDRSDRERPSTRSRTPLIEKREKKDVQTTQENERKKSPEKLSSNKSLAKQKISYRTERPPPTMDKRFERKIEIKIKNPSKYERSGKSKVLAKNEVASSSCNVDRKVNIEQRDDDSDEEDDDDFEPEIVIDNGSDDECSNFNEGDLRAQLSKKRAQKLHKIPVEQVSSRLLKYALKGAVFKKSKKKSKEKDITSSDGKPPIHLRLGIGNQLELFTETRTKRKSRKRKNRELLEQV